MRIRSLNVSWFDKAEFAYVSPNEEDFSEYLLQNRIFWRWCRLYSLYWRVFIKNRRFLSCIPYPWFEYYFVSTYPDSIKKTVFLNPNAWLSVEYSGIGCFCLKIISVIHLISFRLFYANRLIHKLRKISPSTIFIIFLWKIILFEFM